MNINGTELEQVVHTHRSSCRSGWPNNVWWTKSQSSLLNSYLGSAVGPVFFATYWLPLWSEYLFTLHHTEAHNLSDMWHSTFEIRAAQLRSVKKMPPKSPFLCANRGPFWYDFSADSKATCYTVNIAARKWSPLSLVNASLRRKLHLASSTKKSHNAKWKKLPPSLKRTTCTNINLKTERWFTSAISRPASRAFLLWRITHNTVPIRISKLAVATATNAPMPAESVAGLELSSIVWWSKKNKEFIL